jgi:hypothetical protein
VTGRLQLDDLSINFFQRMLQAILKLRRKRFTGQQIMQTGSPVIQRVDPTLQWRGTHRDAPSPTKRKR